VALPPLEHLVSMQNSSEEEEGDTYTRPTKSRLISQLMRHWKRHKNAAANSINNCGKKLNKIHQLQRIPAKVAAPLSVLGDDMPDNDDADEEPAKRHYLKRSPPAWLT